jgi:hypothetical protein
MRSCARARYLTEAWLVAAIVLGVLQAVTFRYSMNPDGIAYLDMGDAYLRGDWATAIRSHWSPLYAWLLGAAVRLVQPSPNVEFPLVHLVNVFIYCLALGAFTFLLREVVAPDDEETGHLRLPAWAAISLGYATFVWCTLQYMPLGLVTPDLLVSALVYATCGLILRMRRRLSWRSSAVLGVLLGLGYLAKAPMLPLAVVFLVASARILDDRTRRIAHLTAATISLMAVTIPFVAALSLANGRPTLGDSAMLNYLWRIDGAPFVHWQGGPGNIGQPLHHSTLLLERPATFGFDSPFPVTYSAWYAPEYWFSGATPAFEWRGQLRAIADALIVYGQLALDLCAPLAGLAILLALHPQLRFRQAWPWMVLVAPAVAAAAIYSVVLVEARYVAPFLVLLMLGVVSMVQLPETGWRAALVVPFSVVVVLAMLLRISWTTSQIGGSMLAQVVRGRLLAADDQAQVADALHSAGLRPGDPVASGNRAFNAYWARLARVPIVAEVTGYDAAAILEADAEARSAAQQQLLAQPVRAVVAYGWPAQTGDTGWRPVDGTDYFYYIVANR